MLTSDRLKQVVRYEPYTGQFYRLSCKQRPDILGLCSADASGNGYPRVTIDGKRYYHHRLAWLYMTGQWPKNEIDHINGIRLDNRWANLRDVSSTLNKQNMRKPRQDNKSGHLGVSWDSQRAKWIARLKISGGPYKFLGRFSTPEAASRAYLEAKRQYHDGCTI